MDKQFLVSFQSRVQGEGQKGVEVMSEGVGQSLASVFSYLVYNTGT